MYKETLREVQRLLDEGLAEEARETIRSAKGARAVSAHDLRGYLTESDLDKLRNGGRQ